MWYIWRFCWALTIKPLSWLFSSTATLSRTSNCCRLPWNRATCCSASLSFSYTIYYSIYITLFCEANLANPPESAYSVKPYLTVWYGVNTKNNLRTMLIYTPSTPNTKFHNYTNIQVLPFLFTSALTTTRTFLMPWYSEVNHFHYCSTSARETFTQGLNATQQPPATLQYILLEHMKLILHGQAGHAHVHYGHH